jgi:hypothetical protein
MNSLVRLPDLSQLWVRREVKAFMLPFPLGEGRGRGMYELLRRTVV